MPSSPSESGKSLMWAPPGAPHLAIQIKEPGQEITWDRFLAGLSVRMAKMDRKGAVEEWAKTWEEVTGNPLQWLPTSLDQLPNGSEFREMLTDNGISPTMFPMKAEVDEETQPGIRERVDETESPAMFLRMNWVR